MGKKKSVEFEVGRHAGTGQFIPVSEAERHPRTTVVETIKRPSNTHKPERK